MSKKKPEIQTEKRPIGRPSIYTPELAREICSRLMTGESLNKICSDNDMPDKKTICNWLADEETYSEFIHQYARARKVQAELMADEIIDIADDSSEDQKPHPFVEGATQTDHEHIQRSKLRVDTRKWVASKLLPKKYGDRLDVDHTTKGEQIRGWEIVPASFKDETED